MSPPLPMRVLVADDSLACRMSLKELLESWNYRVLLAEDGTQAAAMLQTEHAPKLAILDCIMPGLTGPEICAQVRTRQESSGYVYIILLTAKGEHEEILRGFELGADDYLTKPFDKMELRARLKAGERIIRTNEELFRTREALRREATYDSLTGVWNRRAILKALSAEISRATRLNRPLSIFITDIDHFKSVNDTYGHLAGDDVLRSVALRIGHGLRAYDKLGRIGGEEFLAVLPDSDVETGSAIAERVRRGIADSPAIDNPVHLSIAASFGVAQWLPGQEIRELLRQADTALYEAKRQGRNRVRTAA